MIHTKRTGWSVHDETMDDLGNNNGEKMAQAVRSGPAQLGQSHVPQALGLQPAPELLEGADWAGSLRSVGGRGLTPVKGDLRLGTGERRGDLRLETQGGSGETWADCLLLASNLCRCCGRAGSLW